MNYSISELIYNEGLIFSLKFIFSKEYFDYLLSQKCSEQFLLSLPPRLNLLVIWQKGESQNGGNKNTKQANFPKNECFLPPDMHTCVRIKG